MKILDEHWKALADRERALLEDAAGFLGGFGAPEEDVELVRRKLADVEELFMLVIVGEFNSGKSAFVNALLGARISAEGVTPTTDRITLLRHADEPVERERRGGVVEKGYPNEFLREVAIVDTPGTNAIIRQHEELSKGFVPRSDLVLFVTSAERPITESERGYLEMIRDWGKKVVLVVNKTDLLRDETAREEVRLFVEDGLRSTLGLKPPIFFVSAYLAHKAKETAPGIERDALLRASGFEELERYVRGLLDEEGRVRLKLESPLGVVEELARRYGRSIGERLSLLEDDFRTAEDVEAQLGAYREDMSRDFEARLAEIENIVLSLNERGDAWFEDNIRLMNFRELLRREKVEQRFREEVVADTGELLDARVDELVDWLVDRNLKQWRAIVEYVNRRRHADYDERMVGEVGDNFEYNRGRVLRSVGENVGKVARGYDREKEARDVSLSIQNALAQTAAVGVVGAGLGAVVVALATSRFLDVTGVVAAAILAGYGLLVLPRQRRKAREEFREKTDALKRRLSETVRRQFEAELGRSVEGMREAIAPYTRFVRVEHARMKEADENLARISAEADSLREEIGAPGVSAP